MKKTSFRPWSRLAFSTLPLHFLAQYLQLLPAEASLTKYHHHPNPASTKHVRRVLRCSGLAPHAIGTSRRSAPDRCCTLKAALSHIPPRTIYPRLPTSRSSSHASYLAGPRFGPPDYQSAVYFASSTSHQPPTKSPPTDVRVYGCRIVREHRVWAPVRVVE